MTIPSRFEKGLRVTDEAVLPVVVAVFSGLVNKRIVTAINAAGGRAVGISGADGRLLGVRREQGRGAGRHGGGRPSQRARR